MRCLVTGATGYVTARWHDATVLLTRRFRHDRVAAWLAARADAELAALVRAASRHGVGVGGATSIADVNGVPVFVKRIPITDRGWLTRTARRTCSTCRSAASTACTACPAPGFNAWRELAANHIGGWTSRG